MVKSNMNTEECIWTKSAKDFSQKEDVMDFPKGLAEIMENCSCLSDKEMFYIRGIGIISHLPQQFKEMIDELFHMAPTKLAKGSALGAFIVTKSVSEEKLRELKGQVLSDDKLPMRAVCKRESKCNTGLACQNS